MFTAAARTSFARAWRSPNLSEYRGDKSMIGISSAVQSRGGVFKTSRNTGPYAVRSSSFEVVGGVIVVVVDISMLELLVRDITGPNLNHMFPRLVYTEDILCSLSRLSTETHNRGFQTLRRSSQSPVRFLGPRRIPSNIEHILSQQRRGAKPAGWWYLIMEFDGVPIQLLRHVQPHPTYGHST